jgi:hypothetical protein
MGHGIAQVAALPVSTPSLGITVRACHGALSSRRGRDSNPRGPGGATGSQGLPLGPLGHPGPSQRSAPNRYTLVVQDKALAVIHNSPRVPRLFSTGSKNSSCSSRQEHGQGLTITMPYYLSHANTQTQADQPQSRHVVHLPDGHSSCYRTPGTHLGSSCWEPSWVTISGRGR